MDRYIGLMRDLKKDSVSIAVLPETALLFNLPTHPEQLAQLRGEVNRLHMGLVSGFPDLRYYRTGGGPCVKRQHQRNGRTV